MFTQTRPALRRVADALSSPLPVDAYLGLLDPLWSSTSLKGRVVSVTPETHRSATITIYPGRGFGGYEAGQWVTVGVEIDGVRHRRCYSLTSNPERSEGLISITVSAMPEGLVSNHLVYGTEPGDYLTLEQPSGDFHLPADRTNPMLFITGGSGITPAMGMIRTLVGAEECHDVVLLHHAPDASETIFAAELAELDKRTPGLTVNVAHTGVADRLNIERFVPKARPAAAGGEGGRVSFTSSGGDTVLDGSTTLLDGAEAAGLSPASGCRMGICHTCVVPLESGCVRDVRTGELTSDPGTHVQVCVSVAAGDVEIAL